MMSKKISVYELLGLIKDGKAPKKIKVLDDFYEYDKYNKFYYNEEGYSLYRLFYEEGNALDIEVEILEEDKPIIESISIIGKDIHKLENLGIYNIIEDIETKLNEVIEFLNRKEDN